MSNTQKFTGRAKNYTEARPSYAEQLIDYLYNNYITVNSVVADIGCGTGKFTKQLLDRGNIVYGVEPNEDMRDIAAKELASYRSFSIVNGTSSKTGLNDTSVDFITVAQAFHWFDNAEFYTECKRILKSEGNIALIWNTRDMTSPFNQESYNIYKKYCPKFKGFGGGISDDTDKINDFFKNKYDYQIFDNPLTFNKEKFIKRSLSASYSLTECDKEYNAYIAELSVLFDRYADNNAVMMSNKTIAYIGTI